MSLERRRAVLEAVLVADDSSATDRLRAIEALAELDQLEAESRFQRQPQEPHFERDPDRIEKILALALKYVGPELIEARAEERARELLAELRL